MRSPNLAPRDCLVGVHPVYTVSKPTSLGLSGRDSACLCGVLTYEGMSFIAKAVLIFAIYNASKPGPFVSDRGIGSKYLYFFTFKSWLERERGWILFYVYNHVFED